LLCEVRGGDLPAVCRTVTDCCRERAPFALSVESAGAFPNPRRPGTLWAGIGQGVQELVALHDALEPLLLDLGCYRREERKYTPHITLGRGKSDRPVDRLAAALAKQSVWRGG